jgi:hypothetical protein
MEETPDKDAIRKMWCFWICLGVILLFFVVTFSTTVGNVKMNYTLYDKLTDGKPSGMEVRTTNSDPYPR